MPDPENNSTDNLLGSGNGSDIPEKFFQPDVVEVKKEDGSTEKVNFDFDGLKIPEKLVIKKDDGSIDHEKTAKRILASTNKAVSSYTALEKRLGSYEAPPEKEDGYKLDYAKFPENMKPTPDREKAFLKRLHGMGYNNKQAQGAFDIYAELINEGLNIQNQFVPEVEGELKKVWGESFDGNVKQAQLAINALLDDEDKGNIGKIGFDQKITYRMLMKVLSKVGADLKEDNPPAGEGAAGQEGVETLMRSDAYLKADHPEHDIAVKKVNAHYEKTYGNKK